MSSTTLHPFEELIVRACLRGGDPWVAELRRHLPFLRVAERKVFPDGIKVVFEYSRDCPGAQVPHDSAGYPASNYPPAVLAYRSQPSRAEVAFNLWINAAGHIATLEGASLEDDKWPDPAYEHIGELHDGSGAEVVV
jgi:hypothetical protein